jgi:hypothetical protein
MLYELGIFVFHTQGFQYFSSLLVHVLHYLHVVLFIKIGKVFMNILHNTL